MDMIGAGAGARANKVVCVIGATGFIASWLVKLLLDRGYTVNATVRSLDDPRKTAHLVALNGAKERLHLFEANLIEDGSFDPALDGCHGVFHTASPAFPSAADPQADLIVPAVKGTLNVLTSCAKFPSIKRVVVTSSMSAVMVNGRALKSGIVIDETWFTDPAFCEQSKLWYPLSKALAEVEAWKFSKLNGIDMVMLHPGLTIGPLLQPTLNASCQGIFNMLRNGTNSLPKEMHRYVDVRDVARAHISAFEIPSASGRYCLVGTVTNYYEVMRIFHKVYPANELPEDCKEDYKPDILSYEVSKERAKSLGIDFIPFEETIKDFVECLKGRKLL